jgi:amino-acid N-acetyltransferase
VTAELHPTPEPAQVGDAEAIAALLERNRDVVSLLLPSVARVREHLDEYLVVRESGELRGCARVCRHRPNNSELMSLAVDPDHQGEGIGRACVYACVEEVRAERETTMLWLATTSPGYFRKLGFEPISMSALPWTVLLTKLGELVRQPLRRAVGILFGHQTFLRWPFRREARPRRSS